MPENNCKNIIKNPVTELDKNIQTKLEPKENILVSGSNYQNIVPNVGVRIQEEDKTKTGGLDFKNQFGRMSMKEYELLRKKYAQKNEPNFNKNDYNFNCNYENNYNNNNRNIEKERWKRSETYDKAKLYQINNINSDNQNSNEKNKNNIYLNSNNNHMLNIGLKQYDWGSDEKATIPKIIDKNYILKKINNYKINVDNNGNKVLNENLFKRSVKKKISIYRGYYSDKKVNYKMDKEKDGKDINYFNNQIMQNKNWGNVSESYNVGKKF